MRRDGATAGRGPARHTTPARARAARRWWATRSHVAFEDARLGQAGQALADGAGAALADTVDVHELLEVGREQLLEAAEVLDEAVDDGARKPRHLGEQPVAAGADRGVERVPADREADGLGAG